MKHLFYVILLSVPALTYCQSSNQIEWMHVLGSSTDENAHATFLDETGNVYVTGGFQGNVDFDESSNTNILDPNGNDIFITKYDPAGGLVWAKQIGGSGNDHGRSIIADDTGNVYVSGYFSSNCDFDPSASTQILTSEGSYDYFIVKLNSNGDFVWAKTFGGDGNDIGYDLCFDISGNILFTGSFSNTIDFSPLGYEHSISSQGGLDVIFGSIKPDGVLNWVLGFGGLDWDNGFDVSSDESGNCFVSGRFMYNLQFEENNSSSTANSNGGIDAFIAKFSSNGSYTDHFSFGGSNDDYGFFSVAPSGNVYCGGHSNGTFEIDSFIFDSVGGTDTFYGKFDPNFNLLWMNQFGGSGDDKGQIITTDASENIVFLGEFESTIDLDPSANTVLHTSNGGIDIFICKYSTNGNLQWSRTYGSNVDDWSYSLSLSGYDISAAGWFGADVTYDTHYGEETQNGAGGKDIFVFKITKNASIYVDENQIADYKLYPNPSSGAITIDISHAYQIDIFDSNGNLVYAENQQPGIHQVDLKHLSQGIYFVHGNNSSSSWSAQILIGH
ncbi:MAG: SBBP repeat-containing protein [Flavobacteriales bacterium]|nr:SBBP repeat-containing protein [Flavobacteriales bacterium]